MARISISDVEFIHRQVKDYLKPFRFTLSLWWTTPDHNDIGVDIKGCMGGRGKDGRAEWRMPMHRAGAFWVYTGNASPALYNIIQGALEARGYFGDPQDPLGWLDAVAGLPAPPKGHPSKPATELGFPGGFDVPL